MTDYSNKNFQNASFVNQDLADSNFSGSDLRGANFSGANLTAAVFTNVTTGITALNKILIFVVALLISLLSGYVAMLAGSTIHRMTLSVDAKVRTAGIVSIVVTLLFLGYYYWKGGRSVIKHILIPVILLSAVLGSVGYFSGFGTGKGFFFLIISLFLVVIMVTIGTVGRAIAGVLSSSIIFFIVAAAGSIFGKSLGGGVGTVIMAIACALISKRALSGAEGFESLRKITYFITSKFGTSFRNAKLSDANFSHSKINNTDFTNADISSIKWGDCKLVNCTPIAELKHSNK